MNRNFNTTILPVPEEKNIYLRFLSSLAAHAPYFPVQINSLSGDRPFTIFDLEKDPHETTDLSSHTDYLSIKSQLFDKFREKQQEFEDMVALRELQYYNKCESVVK